VMHGFLDTPFHGLKMYSEVLQDSTFDLMDAGKMDFASGSSITLSERMAADVFPRLSDYKSRLVLRPQEISNHPEIVRRLGIIAINTALEFDIYGNVNSTHVMGTNMMNGIGGSGDFARNAYLSVFVTKSTAKDGRISSIVPMVSHVDHTEHDVDILVTEQGLADLRGLAPRERARVIIANCVDPEWQGGLQDYSDRAVQRGGHTPHLLEEALSWHDRLRRTGTMKPE
jgi:succinyl-CoA:acetate CoA-transferase